MKIRERRSNHVRGFKRARSLMAVAAIATGAILGSALAANAITPHRPKTVSIRFAGVLSHPVIDEALPPQLRPTVGPKKKVVLTGHYVTGGPIKFESNGRVSITRLWDAFNNCVEQDGTQIADLQVHAGQENTRLGVTTVSSGWCFFKRSRMHWKVTLLDSAGHATDNTAEIELSQGGPTRALDYTWDCGQKRGSMKCRHSDILGTNVALSWS